MSSRTETTAQGGIAVRTQALCKTYRIYSEPIDRLKQMLWPGRRRFYREFHALRGVELEIRKGETVGVIGRNGSGKSTLLRLIAGLLEPSTGRIDIHGKVAPLLSIGAGFNPEFTGRENAFLNGSILGLRKREIEEKMDEISAFADIGSFLDQPVRSYSSGMYSRLAFAVAINSDPDILLVDEVLAVGDEAFRRKCFARIDAIKEQGATILLATHSAHNVIELCDRAVLIEAGERLLTGPPKAVVSHYQRLLYATDEQRASVLEEIAKLDRSGVAGTSRDNIHSVHAIDASKETLDSEDTGNFEAGLRPESTVEYTHRGARIENIRILDRRGRVVNILRPWQSYTYAYDVEFLETANSVRFGMMLKATSGFELGGQVSAPAPSKGVETICAGTRWEARFQFKPTLVPGTYFLNAGVRGRQDEEDTYLHRILDAAIFRIDPTHLLHTTGLVDFSGGVAPMARESAHQDQCRESL